ncbi:alpha-ketoglutarate-dependent sulfonate dioxygenase [[Candida] jaroonii]|uniref:Alpha-ketoglutarate-dependent sulfonate dioxygenase n=1 Tax=[Candida] jaroonii TaxID=467808 RepID=A0ACA9YC53_9ASCO|nr:alpha-ketoglutarate-dependent sulfonate dioxygenase [[Candida] jaroonii]
MSDIQKYGNYDVHFVKGVDEVLEDGTFVVNSEGRRQSQYPDFLPSWNPKDKFPPLKFHKYVDPGLRADKDFKNLFPSGLVTEDYKVKRITPKLGSEVDGVQLSSLDDKGKDDLALFVAKRGVVVFRNQDFATKGPQFAVDYGKHFGELHCHPTGGVPINHPELLITYRRADKGEFERVFQQNTNAVLWHSDISYELQPSGYTFFTVLEGPDAGGDTIFANAVEAYNRLSPEFQKRLQGLHVLHTSEDQAANSRSQQGVERRKPVSNIHPLIRVHPATGDKYIYINRPFSRRIVELKQQESDFLLEFLYKHIESASDLQLRANWEPNTVVVWDNRVVQHSAIIDWDEPVSRHAFRITPMAERPVESLEDLNKEDLDLGDVKEELQKIAP